jgi:hypothetical protein
VKYTDGTKRTFSSLNKIWTKRNFASTKAELMNLDFWNFNTEINTELLKGFKHKADIIGCAF